MPLVTPLSDAEVDYVLVAPGGQTIHQHMRWSARLERQRVEMEDSATVMLTDYRLRALMVLDTTRRTATVTEAPGHPAPPGAPAPGQWTRLGASSVAGQDCVLWRGADSDGQPGDFCYTADGLLLSASRSGQVLLRAQSVSRAAQAESLFDPPPGYRRAD